MAETSEEIIFKKFIISFNLFFHYICSQNSLGLTGFDSKTNG
nr:MAG TPA: hypothetical protein [Caudoviricetes sp.]